MHGCYKSELIIMVVAMNCMKQFAHIMEDATTVLSHVLNCIRSHSTGHNYAHPTITDFRSVISWCGDFRSHEDGVTALTLLSGQPVTQPLVLCDLGKIIKQQRWTYGTHHAPSSSPRAANRTPRLPAIVN